MRLMKNVAAHAVRPLPLKGGGLGWAPAGLVDEPHPIVVVQRLQSTSPFQEELRRAAPPALDLKGSVRRAGACALALFVVVTASSARAQTAQDWPARQVTFVLPFAPGGAIDIYARAYAQKLSEKFGKPFVVENRPGAGTVVAASSVARAAPDGHTILVSPSPLAINATLYKKLPYDTAGDFMPVAYVADIPLVLVVHPSLPVKSIPDLIAYAKANPGKLAYASSGTGTTLHLSGEMLKSMTGIQMTHVPYKGGPPALNDVVAGHVQLVFADPSSAVQQIRAGTVRPLGITSKVRLPTAPEIPPIAEAGVPGFEAVSWTVFVAPSKTPEPIAARLHAELIALAATSEMREQTVKLSMLPVTSPSLAALQKFLPQEIERWGKLVQQAGIAGTE
jgi:tripartite-type tricarboxylate transporter receptor subunit TctC